MIKFKEEVKLQEFKAWSGGKDRLEMIIEQDLINEVADYINEIYYEESPTKTEINDILWFDEYIDELIDWET